MFIHFYHKLFSICSILLIFSACAGNMDYGLTEKNKSLSYTDNGWGIKQVAELDWDNAEDILVSHLSNHPEDPFLLANLAYVYSKTGREEMARETLTRIKENDKDQKSSFIGSNNSFYLKRVSLGD
ncbi:MAG: hypothetical protein CBC47_07025 [Alphaproteobacteria bacterium TMED87]|nr:hypothetical protein [Rhodospirillaceae bacterium]OUV08667.1 MAG: hypothetical protein CBC47_07025 [Alphaproteobacteria bacterium TMED87]